jgi:hypothetical protein
MSLSKQSVMIPYRLGVCSRDYVYGNEYGLWLRDKHLMLRVGNEAGLLIGLGNGSPVHPFFR